MTSTAPAEAGAREVLKSSGFGSFLAAFAADAVGDLLWFVTLGWVSAQASGVWSGIIFCAGALPAALGSLIGGPLVDRFGSARTVIYTELARTIGMVAWIAAIGFGVAPLSVIPVLAFLIGCIDGLHQPGLSVFTVDLVSSSGQTTAASLEKVTYRTAQIVSGGLGGWLLSSWGLSGPAIVAAVLFAAAIALFIWIVRRNDIEAPSGDKNVLREAAAGLRMVRLHAVLSRTIPVQGLYNAITAGLTLIGYPLKARSAGWSAGQFGLAYAAWGIGLLGGTLLALRYLAKVQRKIALALFLIAAVGGCLIALGVTSNFALFLGLSSIFGVISGPVTPSLEGYVRSFAKSQANPGALLGVQNFATIGIEPLGFLGVGMIAGLISATGAFVGLGSFVVLMAVLSLLSSPVRAAVSR